MLNFNFMPDRTYIAIDLKSFYASVECVERALDPLTTNLVVADQSRTEKTICLAVTPSLKAYGLSGRSRLFEVVQKAREVKRTTGKDLEYIVAVPRMSLYIKYSAMIYRIYLKYFSPDDVHVYSIDEVFIDATEYLKLYKTDVESLARKVIKDILQTTGVTATCGIAPNLYLCKIAMDVKAKHIPADENGVRIAILDEMSYRREFWDHKPITDFWRVGPGTQERLRKYGMFTMGDIARRSIDDPNQLYKIFGIDAEILIDHAWGYEPCSIKDIKEYKGNNHSLSSGQVLSCPYDMEKARLVVQEMVHSLVIEMHEKNISAPAFTLNIFYDRISLQNGDFNGETQKDYYGREAPKTAHGTANLGAPTSSDARITEAVLGIFDQIVDPKLYAKKINLVANGIVDREFEQKELFDEDTGVEKEKKIQNAMMKIQKRYGKNSLFHANDLEEGATLLERNTQIGGHRG